LAEIEVVCPKCGTRYGIDEKSLGRRARCKKCDTRFELASSVATPEHSAEGEPQPKGSGDAAPASTRKTAEDNVPAVWKPGDVILDLYEVKEIVGEGGFGTVYRVHHRGWDVDLAVKSPRPDKFRTEREKERFVRECQTWVDLGLHPHTVSCHYVRTLAGIPRVFAEYVAGGTLKARLPPLPGTGAEGEGVVGATVEMPDLNATLDLAIQICWGMAFAHSKGLIHRDLKPANVLVTTDGTAKVTDFGLARQGVAPAEDAADAADAPRTVSVQVSTGAGTPGYAAPEQVAAGRTVDHRADVFAFGVTLWRMLGGRITWADNLRKSVIAGRAVRALLKRGESAGLPQPLVDLILRCLEPEAEDRWPDFAAVAAELGAIYAEAAGQAYTRPEPKPTDLLADGLNNHGVSMCDLNRPEEAEQFFDRALEADSLHPESSYNGGLLRWRRAAVTDDRVVAQLALVEQSQGDDWRPHHLLGLVHLERGAAEVAVNCFNRALELGAGDDVRKLLELAQGELAQTVRLEQTFEGHKHIVESVAISPDNRLAVSGSLDRRIRVWDMATGQCLKTLGEEQDLVRSVACSPDGRLIASAHGRPKDGKDNTLRLWEIETGRCLTVLEGHTGLVASAAFSPDGRSVLSAAWDGNLRLWDVAGGACIRTFGPGKNYLNSVAFGPDGTWAVATGIAGLAQWDTTTGECLQEFRRAGHGQSVAVSPDGRSLLHAVSDDKNFALWSIETGERIRTFSGHTRTVTSVRFSLDGCRALSGGDDNTARLWDLSSGRCLHTFQGHERSVTSVTFGPNGDYVLSGSFDRTLRLWRIPQEPRGFRAPNIVCRVSGAEEATSRVQEFSRLIDRAEHAAGDGDGARALDLIEQARAVPGRQRAAAACDLRHRVGQGGVRVALKDIWLARQFRLQDDGWCDVDFAPDGEQAICGCCQYRGGVSEESSVQLWDVRNGRNLWKAKSELVDVVTSVKVSPCGRWTLDGTDKKARLRDLQTGTVVREFENENERIKDVEFSPDGKWLLTASGDVLELWETKTGRLIRTMEVEGIHAKCVAFSPDGRLGASGAWSSKVLAWDLATGQCVRKFQAPSHSQGLCVGFTPQETRLFSGHGSQAIAEDDYVFRFWDLATGEVAATFSGHTQRVNAVSISRDSRWAVSGSSDGTMRLWDVASSECLRTCQGHEGQVISAQFSPNGRWALSGGSDGSVCLWELDWDYEFPKPADWNEAARSYLEIFLTLHTPYRGQLAEGREPADEDIRAALTRTGKPTWNDADFDRLLIDLQHAGCGWLQPEGVRRKLEEMVADWQGPPPAPWEEGNDKG